MIFLSFCWLRTLITSVRLGLTCSLLFLSMAVRHHVLKHLDLNENLIMKFLNDLYMNDSLVAVIFLNIALNFIYESTQL